MNNFTLPLSLLLTIIGVALPAVAQLPPVAPPSSANVTPGAPGQVAMVMLRVEHNKGRDYIVTPKGLRAQVPGKGVSQNAKAVAVYQDQDQKYWYIDKHGEPTPVRPEVVQSAMAQFQAQINQSQAASQVTSPTGALQTSGGVPVQQTTIINQAPAGGGSGGAGMMGAASMAMSGTALGMSIGALANSSQNSYYGVPYGKPIYNNNHHYYYNNNSSKVFVSPNVNNKQYFNEFNKQGTWNNRASWNHAAYPAASYNRGYARGFRR